MHDVLVVGGGVIGLSLAWDLARHGQKVQVIDQGQPGREASWAGAGILPPANQATAIHPYDQLCGLSAELHPRWADELKAVTAIDTGYRRCGGIYLARTPGETASLAAWAADQAAQGITAKRLRQQELATLEPGLHGWGGQGTHRAAALPSKMAQQDLRPPVHVHRPPLAAWLLPDESQLRNPRHLQALIAACQQSGVEITANVEATGLNLRHDGIQGIATSLGKILCAHRYCLTSGAWTGKLLGRLVPLPVLPLRGQMVLFRCPSPPIRHIVNEGSRYLVPRDDGLVLAGSTEEEVGFDKRTTEEAIAELAAFARDLVPALVSAPIERTWAGLRPATFDGLPYLGLLPGTSNAFVAAGHFRSGLYLSPATAVVMSQLIRGERPEIDLGAFRVGR